MCVIIPGPDVDINTWDVSDPAVCRSGDATFYLPGNEARVEAKATLQLSSTGEQILALHVTLYVH